MNALCMSALHISLLLVLHMLLGFYTYLIAASLSNERRARLRQTVQCCALLVCYMLCYTVRKLCANCYTVRKLLI